MRRFVLVAIAPLLFAGPLGAAGFGSGGPGSGPGYPGYGVGGPGYGPGHPGYGVGGPGYGPGQPGYGIGSPGQGKGRPGSGWFRPDFRGPSGRGNRGTYQGYGRGSDAGRGRGPSSTGINPRQDRFRTP
jgi:hypothetical protein